MSKTNIPREEPYLERLLYVLSEEVFQAFGRSSARLCQLEGKSQQNLRKGKYYKSEENLTKGHCSQDIR